MATHLAEVRNMQSTDNINSHSIIAILAHDVPLILATNHAQVISFLTTFQYIMLYKQ